MDLTLTAAHGTAAYTALNRLVARVPSMPTPVPGGLTSAAPMPFDPSALLAPPAGMAAPAPDTAVPPGAPAGGLAPPLVLPQTPPSAAAKPTLATITRATTLYAQGQQLGGALAPAQLPADSAAPTHEVAAAPAPDVFGTPPVPAPSEPGGVVGINSLGGAAESAARLLSFTRGSFLNILV